MWLLGRYLTESQWVWNAHKVYDCALDPRHGGGGSTGRVAMGHQLTSIVHLSDGVAERVAESRRDGGLDKEPGPG